MPKPRPEKHALIADLATQHGRQLERYLSRHLRNRTDVPDVTQEVYLRLLRVERPAEIRNPEAYLLTIAGHLVYEHKVRQAAAPPVIELEDAPIEFQVAEEDVSTRVAVRQRFEAFERAVARLSPRMRTTLLMHRRDGFSLEEIGTRLGISRNVAKKYLAKALFYCRKNLGKE